MFVKNTIFEFSEVISRYDLYNFFSVFWDTSEVALHSLLWHSFTFIFIEYALQKMWNSRKIH